MTAGAVLDTVTQAANTVTDIVKTAGSGVTIVNRFVESAATDQKDRQLIHRKTFRDRLLQESRMEVARRNLEVLAFVSESDDYKLLYQEAEAYLPDSIFGE
jgi:hypothetical protein